MKGTITLVSILFTLLIISNKKSIAQNELDNVLIGKVEKETIINKRNKSSFHREWVNFSYDLSLISSNMPLYSTYLFPDSSVLIDYGTSLGNVWLHSFGQVFDPNSSLYHTNSTLPYQRDYSLDSIAIPYKYNRVQSGAPDTLIIQFTKHDDMTFVPAPPWSTPRSFARVPYNYVENKAKDPTKEIIVLLEDDDTSTVTNSFIVEEVNIGVNPGEKIAISMSYRPGNAFNIGDTLDFEIPGKPDNQINAFKVFYYLDEDATLDNDYYNHALFVTESVRYNDTANADGWEGNYIPGVAWGNSVGNYQSDIYFQAFWIIPGREEFLDPNIFSVYPNPASDNIVISSNFSNENDLYVDFTDVLGNRIFSMKLGNNSLSSIDISQWTTGMYFYTLKTDKEVIGSSRLIINR